MTFLDKQSAYAISTKLGIDVRTVERTLKEGTKRLNKSKYFQVINIRMIVWYLPFVVMDDLSWAKGKNSYEYFFEWLKDINRTNSEQSTKLLLF